MPTERDYPSIHASTSAEQSALAFSHRSGLNATSLNELSQVIYRLAQFGQTMVSPELSEPLQELVHLEYIEVESWAAGGLAVSLLAQPALLTNYFWSVWVPRHLLSAGLKVTVMPHLPPGQEGQGEENHCTVVFRIPGSREATREFLTDIATQYPGSTPEIVAIQAGNALRAEIAEEAPNA